MTIRPLLAFLLFFPALLSAADVLVLTQDCPTRRSAKCANSLWLLEGEGATLLQQWPAARSEMAHMARDEDGDLRIVDGWDIRTLDGRGVMSRPQRFKSQFLTGITFDSSGNSWVGVYSFGKERLRRFDRDGRGVSVSRHSGTVRHIDLAGDQCTMYFAGGSDDPSVHAYNVCADQPMQDLVRLDEGTSIRQLRALRDDGLLVVTPDSILRLDASGALVTTFSVAGVSDWRDVSPAPDGHSFVALAGDSIWTFDLADPLLASGPRFVAGERVLAISTTDELRAGQATSDRPLPPSDLHVTWFSDGRHLIEWTDNSDDEDHFLIEYSHEGEKFQELGTLRADTTFATVVGWDPMKYYRFRVRAISAAGASGWSNEKSFWD